jgi:hypothetical protein
VAKATDWATVTHVLVALAQIFTGVQWRMSILAPEPIMVRVPHCSSMTPFERAHAIRKDLA